MFLSRHQGSWHTWCKGDDRGHANIWVKTRALGQHSSAPAPSPDPRGHKPPLSGAHRLHGGAREPPRADGAELFPAAPQISGQALHPRNANPSSAAHL